MYYQW